LAIGVEGALDVALALRHDPTTELAAIDGVRVRNASVTVAFDILQELAETLLPLLGLRAPCPAGQGLEP
jgi:hypothetical protein